MTLVNHDSDPSDERDHSLDVQWALEAESRLAAARLQRSPAYWLGRLN